LMNALREQLRGRDPYYLQALLKNGDSDDPLVRAAYAELTMRGQVPEYAEGLFDSPAGDMPDNLAASATPIAVDPDVKITSFGRRVVGPRTATGNAPVPGEYFQSEDEAEAYYNRGIDPKTGDVIASGADAGMLERGFRPVYKADGTVGYSVAAGTEGMSTGMGGAAPVNRAYQEQLMQPDRAKGFPQGRFQQGGLPGPLGASTEVMVPTDETRQYNARLNERRQKLNYLDRMERDKPGFDRSTAEIPETQEDRYFAEESARRSRRASSEAERRAMAKRVGGSQNINAGNAEAIRDLVNMDPTRREELVADNMGPRNIEQRFDPRTGRPIAYSNTRAYPPAGRGPLVENNTTVSPQEQAAMDAMERGNNPSAAGMKDLAARNYTSPQAAQVLDSMAEQFDTGGWNLMSDADEAAFRDHLATLGVPPEDAARVAKQYADKRRWFWLQGSNPADMSPGAWGGAPPQGGM